MNVCQAGHATHASKKTGTAIGPFWIFDWEAYAGFAGYCPGQDDVSMSLDLYGEWENDDWRQAVSVVRPGDKVWEFGSHIGWYTIPCLTRGGDVWAVDSDPENMRLLIANLRGGGRVDYQNVWAVDSTPPPWEHIRLLKADIEGAENTAVRLAAPWIETQHVDYLLIECSPEFDGYYPDLVDWIIGCGYTATHNGQRITGQSLGATQKNVWFTL